MTHLKLTDFATGLPVYVQREAIVSCRQVGPHHKSIESNVAIGYYSTRIDTEQDTFLVRETPEEIMEVATLTPVVAEERRTVAEVLAQKKGHSGCCERHCDNKACDCLENARSRTQDVEYVRCSLCKKEFPHWHSMFGHTRCLKCRELHGSGCSICMDPKCDNPSGKH